MSHTLREVLAGLSMIAIGLSVAYFGSTYVIGSVTQMGPGFFPTALGLILAFMGVLIVVFRNAQEVHQLGVHNFDIPDMRGAICIVVACIAFIAVGEYGGLVPAMFLCVFIAALGDRKMKLYQAILLSVGLTAFVVVLFVHLLNLPLQLWTFDMPSINLPF